MIRAVDGQPVFAFSQLREIVGASDGEPMTLEVWRDGETLEVTLTPRRMDLPLEDGGFETRWLIGISGGLFFEPPRRRRRSRRRLNTASNQTIFIIRSSLSGSTTWRVECDLVVQSFGPHRHRRDLGAGRECGLDQLQSGSSRCCRRRWGLLNLFPIPVPTAATWCSRPGGAQRAVRRRTAR